MPDSASTTNDGQHTALAEQSFRVLVLDDSQQTTQALERFLSRTGFEPKAFNDPHEALRTLESDITRFDFALVDLSMPAMSGLEVLEAIRAMDEDFPVLILSGDKTAETAATALKLGAFDYLTKPMVDIDATSLTLIRAGTHGRLQRRARQLEMRINQVLSSNTLIGRSEPMKELYATMKKLADSDINVLVLGESGTGKELVARAIHDHSARTNAPFVPINCAGLPETLVDSELFGHERGAYTGATAARAGAFERADKGTLFLDEIGDIPPSVQGRLLRVLQERETRRLGSNTAKRVDVRVISATLVDLEAKAFEGVFRQDLYFRLNVVAINLPALRDRIDDLPLLVEHLLAKHVSHGRGNVRFSEAALRAMSQYAWPGNVRELENVVLRALTLSDRPVLDLPSLPPSMRTAAPAATSTSVDAPGIEWADDLPFVDARKRASLEFERTYLTRLLRRSNGNISEAARRSGMDRSNLRRILSRNEIDATQLRGDD